MNPSQKTLIIYQDRSLDAFALGWGLTPWMVTTDAWYSSRENLKFLKNKELGFLMGVAKNRQVSINGRDYSQVQNLEIPAVGLVVYLKKFGRVKVFRKTFKNEDSRYYIMFVPDEDALSQITGVEFKTLHSIHWGIECYHRAIKQVCSIERFMVRTSEAIKTHFFSAIRAFTHLELTLFCHSMQKKSGNLRVGHGMASYRGSDSSTQSNKLTPLIIAELEIDSTKVEANLRSPRAELPSANCSTPVSTPLPDASPDAA